MHSYFELISRMDFQWLMGHIQGIFIVIFGLAYTIAIMVNGEAFIGKNRWDDNYKDDDEEEDDEEDDKQ